MIKIFIIASVKTYQSTRSLLGFSCCRFYPSCSQYALQAVEKHGSFLGTLKALARIFRCSPLSAGGYDPLR